MNSIIYVGSLISPEVFHFAFIYTPQYECLFVHFMTKNRAEKIAEVCSIDDVCCSLSFSEKKKNPKKSSAS